MFFVAIFVMALTCLTPTLCYSELTAFPNCKKCEKSHFPKIESDLQGYLGQFNYEILQSSFVWVSGGFHFDWHNPKNDCQSGCTPKLNNRWLDLHLFSDNEKYDCGGLLIITAVKKGDKQSILFIRATSLKSTGMKASFQILLSQELPPSNQ
jgi:hypothetical protein